MIEQMLEYNRVFVKNEMYKQFTTSKYPDKKIAILTCMDTRLVELLPAALGIRNGAFARQHFKRRKQAALKSNISFLFI